MERWKIAKGKRYFEQLESGDISPEQFEKLMADLELTAETIGEVPETIALAKFRCQQVTEGKRLFKLLAEGSEDISPDLFELKMTDLRLFKPEGIRETYESIDKAKRLWRNAEGRRLFEQLAAGSPVISSSQFRKKMADLGLNPEDIGLTPGAVDEALACMDDAVAEVPKP